MIYVPGARFQVTEVAINAPGNCFVCKTTNGPFVVTGLRHDFWKEAPDASRDGDVYLCAACIREMASMLNLTSVDVQQSVEDARRAGVVEGVLLGKKALDEFSVGFIDSSLGFVGIASPPSDLPSDDDAEDDDADEPDSETSTENSQQDRKPDEKSGRDDLPGNSGDGEFDF